MAWMLWFTALQSLRANALRSLLAMLGVVIGVASVVTMLAIGSGAQESLMSQLDGDGARVLFVFPDWKQIDGRWRPPRPLTIGDAEAIVDLPGVEAVAPILSGSFQMQAGSLSHTAAVVASTHTYPLMSKVPIDRGRHATVAEHELGAPVCILGAVLATKLFPDRDPLDETVVIADMPLRVIGIIKARGRGGFANPDEEAHLPLLTAQRGIIPQLDLDRIQILARSTADLTQVEDGTGEMLLRRHRIQIADDRDFSIWQNKEILDRLAKIAGVFKALLGGIGGIALLVGGIGIMNIMLVSVTERTREIGLRKALGARESDIRNQFLVEAMLTTGCGGVFGIALGGALAWLAGLAMPFKPVLDTSSILTAVVFSIGVGLFFGWYPARRAARLDPIESLRYE